MSSTATKALLLDSLYQVLDNWVFRILLALTTLLILMTFVVGFREDGIDLLFGLKHWSYSAIVAGFSGGNASGMPEADFQGPFIDYLLAFLLNTLMGNAGVIFCVAATAFFVPRMIEKGAADVLLHKPLSRLTFYISRYVSGLLFVGILATYLAVGLYLGFLVGSGHNDPGILFAAPLLTYLFGLIYAVSMLVGVVTRSTVASILLTTLFFFFNGAVHMGWKAVSIQRDGYEFSPAGEDEEAEGDLVEDDEEMEPALRILLNTLSALHYVLPKTGDADVLTSQLRRAVNAPVFREDHSRLRIQRPPAGMELSTASQPVAVSSQIQELLGEPRFAMQSSAELDRVSYTVFRRPLVEMEVERRGRMRTLRENGSKAAASLSAALEASGSGSSIEKETTPLGRLSMREARTIASVVLSWQGTGPDTDGTHHAVLFRISEGGWIYTVWIEDSAPDNPETRAERRTEVLSWLGDEIGFDSNTDPYEERFAFDAPWRFNIFFSLASSLAFVIVMLLMGWWRLSRIDF